ncbi:Nuclear transport factor 2 [Dichanthelium oligosanthes]|uniref:Nuclear transport factor 2 n=1 Tax=Dichanthelium oligosanthes TaxID=888268 RepID=A0A1E5VN19_9POAL|nr:Nuclear transport factor 2 [Dichanthelium oligosanthes]
MHFHYPVFVAHPGVQNADRRLTSGLVKSGGTATRSHETVAAGFHATLDTLVSAQARAAAMEGIGESDTADVAESRRRTHPRLLWPRRARPPPRTARPRLLCRRARRLVTGPPRRRTRPLRPCLLRRRRRARPPPPAPSSSSVRPDRRGRRERWRRIRPDSARKTRLPRLRPRHRFCSAAPPPARRPPLRPRPRRRAPTRNAAAAPTNTTTAGHQRRVADRSKPPYVQAMDGQGSGGGGAGSGDCDAVARAFVEYYYHTFDANRGALAALYGHTSMLSFEGHAVAGAEEIGRKLAQLPFEQCRHSPPFFFCQPSPSFPGSILVFPPRFFLLAGEEHQLRFSQMFQLVPNEQGSFFVQNDIFRLNYG